MAHPPIEPLGLNLFLPNRPSAMRPTHYSLAPELFRELGTESLHVHLLVRAASRRRPDFFVLVLSATVLVLVLDGFSNGSRGDHWSQRLQWLWINTRDGYTVRRRVRVPLIRIRGFPEYEYETEHEQNDVPKPSVDRVDLR
jgi:hypothetical protein